MKINQIKNVVLPLLLLFCLIGCSEDKEPQTYPPTLVTNSAAELTRFEALLSGSVAPAEDKGMSVRELLSSKLLWMALLLMTCAGASELAMSQWASLFAEKSLGISKVMGDLLGPCMFAVLMGTGRLLYGLYGNRLRIQSALMGCAAVCVLSYLLASLSPYPMLSLVGCALCGLSVSDFGRCRA